MRRPQPRHWGLLAILTVALSTTGFAVWGPAHDDLGAARLHEDTEQTGTVPSDPTMFVGMDAAQAPAIQHDPPFALETGTLPTRSMALEFPNRFQDFIAKGSAGLDELAKQGHVQGAGTMDDPYVLERFYVAGSLIIQSTDQALILREGYVAGQLKLNYNGGDVYVHHVYAKDLRVNENVERRGVNTGGLFHDNHFGIVGQIRHFTGAFRDNQVGPAPQGVVREYLSDTGAAELPAGVVFNFDGFHGADVHHNAFHGLVDIKLHGHNHADCLLCPIHHHHVEDGPEEDDEARPQEGPLDGFRSRHSVRYHALLFRDNTIDVSGDAPFGLRYNDRNHAGDDRTAASEPNGFLEDPHVHYQDITLRGNTIKGAPLLVDIFNAADDRHTLQNRGVLRLQDNVVEVPFTTSAGAQPPVYGMHLRSADGITLRATGNTVRFTESGDDLPFPALRGSLQVPPVLAGFRLDSFSAGDLVLKGNTVDRGAYGVWAHALDASVGWVLEDNEFATQQEYRADETANAPAGAHEEGEA